MEYLFLLTSQLAQSALRKGKRKIIMNECACACVIVILCNSNKFLKGKCGGTHVWDVSRVKHAINAWEARLSAELFVGHAMLLIHITLLISL